MADPIVPVNAHMAYIARQIDRFEAAGDMDQAERWGQLKDALQAIIDEVVHLRDITRPVPSSYGDLSDLPPSLRKELAGLRTDELEDQIFTIVKASPKGADLDTILIELWRRFNVEQTRRFIQNKAYRMATLKEVIFSVKGKKGFYAATAEDAERLSTVNDEDSDQDDSGSIDDVFPETEDQEDRFGGDLDEDVPF